MVKILQKANQEVPKELSAMDTSRNKSNYKSFSKYKRGGNEGGFRGGFGGSRGGSNNFRDKQEYETRSKSRSGYEERKFGGSNSPKPWNKYDNSKKQSNDYNAWDSAKY